MITFNPGEGVDNSETILWQVILLPGHEACRLFYEDSV
jgi:hypothetical protein